MAAFAAGVQIFAQVPVYNRHLSCSMQATIPQTLTAATGGQVAHTAIQTLTKNMTNRQPGSQAAANNVHFTETSLALCSAHRYCVYTVQQHANGRSR